MNALSSAPLSSDGASDSMASEPARYSEAAVASMSASWTAHGGRSGNEKETEPDIPAALRARMHAFLGAGGDADIGWTGRAIDRAGDAEGQAVDAAMIGHPTLT
jgi:hypothetical protein